MPCNREKDLLHDSLLSTGGFRQQKQIIHAKEGGAKYEDAPRDIVEGRASRFLDRALQESFAYSRATYRHSHIHDELFFSFEKLGRGKSAEGFELTDEVGLVGVAMFVGYGCQIVQTGVLQLAVHGIEPGNAHVLLGSDAEFVFKLSFQLPGADVYIFNQFVHPDQPIGTPDILCRPVEVVEIDAVFLKAALQVFICQADHGRGVLLFSQPFREGRKRVAQHALHVYIIF